MRISAVSYLNSKPFIYGIKNSGQLIPFDYELQTDLPSVCAGKLLNDKVDLGLVPVTIIPKLKNAHIIPDFCIGANGPVKTVMLYSQVPLNEIRQVYLDYQSGTSIVLARVLAQELWDINPVWTPAFKGYETMINNDVAAVVIGDRTFGMNGKYNFEFDLAEEWYKLTRLPFVFACWVANKTLPEDFITAFTLALKEGVESTGKVATSMEGPDNLHEYFTRYISYGFDDKKKHALDLFLQKANNLTPSPQSFLL